ncbi:MAG: FkbM family methyltransferase [Cyanobacteriota bacterium]|nr:FkbM family methyltransferase [Cyanobacteriota bacterium]
MIQISGYLKRARLRLTRPFTSPRPIPGAPPLRRLGTAYGGWHFLDVPSLSGSTIVSAGVGEDISFDVAIATAHRARVLLVDPTPRAAAHLRGVLERLGQPAAAPASALGSQPVQSYDLSRMAAGQLVAVEKALWNAPGRLRFFAPPDPTHVSFSLINWQNGYRTDSAAMDVEAATLEQVLADCQAPPPALLKLDIEGAEHEVLAAMLNGPLRPGQVLVEYDELTAGTLRGVRRFRRSHGRLLEAGYQLLGREGPNFSYALASTIQEAQGL